MSTGRGGPDRTDPLVFVADVEAPVLAADDERHLRGSLRLRDGASISLADGFGRFRSARLGPELDVTGDVRIEPTPRWELTVAFAPIKAQKPEWLVTKLTELGVDRIVPMVTERAVVRWDDKKAARLAERFTTTVREAAMQCRRSRLPIVEAPITVAAAVARGAVLADPDAAPLGPADRFVAIGPEGGWSPNELLGAPTVGLPGQILRAETAVIVAGAMLAAHRADWCSPTGESPSNA